MTRCTEPETGPATGPAADAASGAVGAAALGRRAASSARALAAATARAWARPRGCPLCSRHGLGGQVVLLVELVVLPGEPVQLGVHPVNAAVQLRIDGFGTWRWRSGDALAGRGRGRTEACDRNESAQRSDQPQ